MVQNVIVSIQKRRSSSIQVQGIHTSQILQKNSKLLKSQACRSTVPTINRYQQQSSGPIVAYSTARMSCIHHIVHIEMFRITLNHSSVLHQDSTGTYTLLNVPVFSIPFHRFRSWARVRFRVSVSCQIVVKGVNPFNVKSPILQYSESSNCWKNLTCWGCVNAILVVHVTV